MTRRHGGFALPSAWALALVVATACGPHRAVPAPAPAPQPPATVTLSNADPTIPAPPVTVTVQRDTAAHELHYTAANKSTDPVELTITYPLTDPSQVLTATPSAGDCTLAGPTVTCTLTVAPGDAGTVDLQQGSTSAENPAPPATVTATSKGRTGSGTVTASTAPASASGSQDRSPTNTTDHRQVGDLGPRCPTCVPGFDWQQFLEDPDPRTVLQVVNRGIADLGNMNVSLGVADLAGRVRDVRGALRSVTFSQGMALNERTSSGPGEPPPLVWAVGSLHPGARATATIRPARGVAQGLRILGGYATGAPAGRTMHGLLIGPALTATRAITSTATSSTSTFTFTSVTTAPLSSVATAAPSPVHTPTPSPASASPSASAASSPRASTRPAEASPSPYVTARPTP